MVRFFLGMVLCVASMMGVRGEGPVAVMQENRQVLVKQILKEDPQNASIVDGQVTDRALMKNFTKMMVVLALFAIGCYGMIRAIQKKGALGCGKGSAGVCGLKVLETKALGSKQFLSVVQYGDKRILLGVTQSSIEYLCALQSPEEGPPGIEKTDADRFRASVASKS